MAAAAGRLREAGLGNIAPQRPAPALERAVGLGSWAESPCGAESQGFRGPLRLWEPFWVALRDVGWGSLWVPCCWLWGVLRILWDSLQMFLWGLGAL